MKNIIVAYDKNYGIGASNDLLWKDDLPADLRHFRGTTMGSAIIMGRRSYDSIGRPLPGRQNIVISHHADSIEGVDVVGSLDEAYKIAKSDEVYIIGGGQIYKLAIDGVDRIYATEVDGEFKADVFFPTIDHKDWREISREHHDKDELNKYNYDFVVYVRR